MARYRIAVLIFLIGASAANYLTVRQQYDRMFTELPVGTSWLSATPTAAPTSWLDAVATAHPTPSNVEEVVDPKEQRQIVDRAAVREAVILTVCGVAWFLIPRAKA